jgi:hypothetical protein
VLHRGLEISSVPPGPLAFVLPYYEQLAEYKAKMQQGPDYNDYRFFLRDLDMAFRQGQYTKVKASFIAYHRQLRDVEDVNVSWKEPWDQPRQPVPQQPPK